MTPGGRNTRHVLQQAGFPIVGDVAQTNVAPENANVIAAGEFARKLWPEAGLRPFSQGAR